MDTPWVFRSLPALGSIGLLVLWSLAASGSVRYMVESVFGLPLGGSNMTESHLTLLAFFEVFLSFYIVAIHLLTLGFPLRNCWAVVIMTWEIASARVWCKEQRQEQIVPGDESPESDQVIHAILMPNYKEDIDTLKDTLDVLATVDSAKSRVDVWLAKEEKDPHAKASAASLEGAYHDAFRSIQSTFHPSDLPGEAQGKSSNVSWAARHAMKWYEHEGLTNRDVIFTVIDADTHLSPDYFMIVGDMHISSRKSDRDISMYVPPVIFDRNAHKVPILVRLADLCWSAASLSGTYPGSFVCIPTSVYSLPMTLARSVGGWDTGPDAIGEDMHMYLKCFFHTAGNLVVRPVPSSASHCNVSSPKRGLIGYLDGMASRWQQALRHMWGSLDTGYAYSRVSSLFRSDNEVPDPAYVGFRKLRRIALLYSRLFEAHCLPVQITLCLIAQALFEGFIPTVITPAPMRAAFKICGYLRPACFVLMVFYFALYRRYHSLCLRIRMEDSVVARLHERGNFNGGAMSFWYWLECFIFPIAGTLYGTIPAFYAQMSHLFTNKLVYTVSLKPLRQLARHQVV